MAMKKCHECGAPISTKAKACPQCGAPRKHEISKGTAIAVIIISLVFFVAIQSPDTPPSPPTDSSPAAEIATAPEKTPKQLAAEEAACREDIQCWGDKHSMSAGIFCAAKVESLAKFAHKWTDAWYEPKFSRFRWKDQEQGHITVLGDKIRFQNAFGAMENHVYECDLDPDTDAVLEVRAYPGHL